MEHELGPLPQPKQSSYVTDCVMRSIEVLSYTEDQMCAYALAEVRKAVAAERERCARVCEEMAREHWRAYDGRDNSRHQEECSPRTEGMADSASECAQAIRVNPNDRTQSIDQD